MPPQSLKFGHRISLALENPPAKGADYLSATNNNIHPLGSISENAGLKLQFENTVFQLVSGDGDITAQTLQRNVGNDIKFGMHLRLFHSQTNTLVAENRRVRASLEKANHGISLDNLRDADSQQTRWRVLPRYKVKSEGNKVLAKDIILLQSSSGESFLRVAASANATTDYVFEACVGQNPTSFSIELYDTDAVADSEQVLFGKGRNEIRVMDCIQLLHREDVSFVSAFSKNACLDPLQGSALMQRSTTSSAATNNPNNMSPSNANEQQQNENDNQNNKNNNNGENNEDSSSLSATAAAAANASTSLTASTFNVSQSNVFQSNPNSNNSTNNNSTNILNSAAGDIDQSDITSTYRSTSLFVVEHEDPFLGGQVLFGKRYRLKSLLCNTLYLAAVPEKSQQQEQNVSNEGLASSTSLDDDNSGMMNPQLSTSTGGLSFSSSSQQQQNTNNNNNILSSIATGPLLDHSPSSLGDGSSSSFSNAFGPSNFSSQQQQQQKSHRIPNMKICLVEDSTSPNTLVCFHQAGDDSSPVAKDHSRVFLEFPNVSVTTTTKMKKEKNTNEEKFKSKKKNKNQQKKKNQSEESNLNKSSSRKQVRFAGLDDDNENQKDDSEETSSGNDSDEEDKNEQQQEEEKEEEETTTTTTTYGVWLSAGDFVNNDSSNTSSAGNNNSTTNTAQELANELGVPPSDARICSIKTLGASYNVPKRDGLEIIRCDEYQELNHVISLFAPIHKLRSMLLELNTLTKPPPVHLLDQVKNNFGSLIKLCTKSKESDPLIREGTPDPKQSWLVDQGVARIVLDIVDSLAAPLALLPGTKPQQPPKCNLSSHVRALLFEQCQLAIRLLRQCALRNTSCSIEFWNFLPRIFVYTQSKHLGIKDCLIEIYRNNARLIDTPDDQSTAQFVMDVVDEEGRSGGGAVRFMTILCTCEGRGLKQAQNIIGDRFLKPMVDHILKDNNSNSNNNHDGDENVFKTPFYRLWFTTPQNSEQQQENKNDNNNERIVVIDALAQFEKYFDNLHKSVSLKSSGGKQQQFFQSAVRGSSVDVFSASAATSSATSGIFGFSSSTAFSPQKNNNTTTSNNGQQQQDDNTQNNDNNNNNENGLLHYETSDASYVNENSPTSPPSPDSIATAAASASSSSLLSQEQQQAEKSSPKQNKKKKTFSYQDVAIPFFEFSKPLTSELHKEGAAALKRKEYVGKSKFVQSFVRQLELFTALCLDNHEANIARVRIITPPACLFEILEMEKKYNNNSNNVAEGMRIQIIPQLREQVHCLFRVLLIAAQRYDVIEATRNLVWVMEKSTIKKEETQQKKNKTSNKKKNNNKKNNKNNTTSSLEDDQLSEQAEEEEEEDDDFDDILGDAEQQESQQQQQQQTQISTTTATYVPSTALTFSSSSSSSNNTQQQNEEDGDDNIEMKSKSSLYRTTSSKYEQEQKQKQEKEKEKEEDIIEPGLMIGAKQPYYHDFDVFSNNNNNSEENNNNAASINNILVQYIDYLSSYLAQHSSLKIEDQTENACVNEALKSLESLIRYGWIPSEEFLLFLLIVRPMLDGRNDVGPRGLGSSSSADSSTNKNQQQQQQQQTSSSAISKVFTSPTRPPDNNNNKEKKDSVAPTTTSSTANKNSNDTSTNANDKDGFLLNIPRSGSISSVSTGSGPTSHQHDSQHQSSAHHQHSHPHQHSSSPSSSSSPASTFFYNRYVFDDENSVLMSSKISILKVISSCCSLLEVSLVSELLRNFEKGNSLPWISPILDFRAVCPIINKNLKKEAETSSSSSSSAVGDLLSNLSYFASGVFSNISDTISGSSSNKNIDNNDAAAILLNKKKVLQFKSKFNNEVLTTKIHQEALALWNLRNIRKEQMIAAAQKGVFSDELSILTTVATDAFDVIASISEDTGVTSIMKGTGDLLNKIVPTKMLKKIVGKGEKKSKNDQHNKKKDKKKKDNKKKKASNTNNSDNQILSSDDEDIEEHDINDDSDYDDEDENDENEERCEDDNIPDTLGDDIAKILLQSSSGNNNNNNNNNKFSKYNLFTSSNIEKIKHFLSTKREVKSLTYLRKLLTILLDNMLYEHVPLVTQAAELLLRITDVHQSITPLIDGVMLLPSASSVAFFKILKPIKERLERFQIDAISFFSDELRFVIKDILTLKNDVRRMDDPLSHNEINLERHAILCNMKIHTIVANILRRQFYSFSSNTSSNNSSSSSASSSNISSNTGSNIFSRYVSSSQPQQQSSSTFGSSQNSNNNNNTTNEMFKRVLFVESCLDFLITIISVPTNDTVQSDLSPFIDIFAKHISVSPLLASSLLERLFRSRPDICCGLNESVIFDIASATTSNDQHIPQVSHLLRMLVFQENNEMTQQQSMESNKEIVLSVVLSVPALSKYLKCSEMFTDPYRSVDRIRRMMRDGDHLRDDSNIMFRRELLHVCYYCCRLRDTSTKAEVRNALFGSAEQTLQQMLIAFEHPALISSVFFRLFNELIVEDPALRVLLSESQLFTDCLVSIQRNFSRGVNKILLGKKFDTRIHAARRDSVTSSSGGDRRRSSTMMISPDEENVIGNGNVINEATTTTTTKTGENDEVDDVSAGRMSPIDELANTNNLLQLECSVAFNSTMASGGNNVLSLGDGGNNNNNNNDNFGGVEFGSVSGSASSANFLMSDDSQGSFPVFGDNITTSSSTQQNFSVQNLLEGGDFDTNFNEALKLLKRRSRQHHHNKTTGGATIQTNPQAISVRTQLFDDYRGDTEEQENDDDDNKNNNNNNNTNTNTNSNENREEVYWFMCIVAIAPLLQNIFKNFYDGVLPRLLKDAALALSRSSEDLFFLAQKLTHLNINFDAALTAIRIAERHKERKRLLLLAANNSTSEKKHHHHHHQQKQQQHQGSSSPTAASSSSLSRKRSFGENTLKPIKFQLLPQSIRTPSEIFFCIDTATQGIRSSALTDAITPQTSPSQALECLSNVIIEAKQHHIIRSSKIAPEKQVGLLQVLHAIVIGSNKAREDAEKNENDDDETNTNTGTGSVASAQQPSQQQQDILQQKDISTKLKVKHQHHYRNNKNKIFLGGEHIFIQWQIQTQQYLDFAANDEDCGTFKVTAFFLLRKLGSRLGHLAIRALCRILDKSSVAIETKTNFFMLISQVLEAQTDSLNDASLIIKEDEEWLIHTTTATSSSSSSSSTNSNNNKRNRSNVSSSALVSSSSSNNSNNTIYSLAEKREFEKQTLSLDKSLTHRQNILSQFPGEYCFPPKTASSISLSSTDAVVAALRCGNILLRNGNVPAQTAILAYFLNATREDFFVFARKFLISCRNNIRDREESKIRQVSVILQHPKNSDMFNYSCQDLMLRLETRFPLEIYTLLLRYLQLFCEGHNSDMQLYMSHQHDNQISINLLEPVISVLEALASEVDPGNFDLTLQTLATLTETIQGPCLQNQKFIISQNIGGIISTIFRSRHPLLDMHQVWLMKMSCMTLLNSLLERHQNLSLVNLLMGSLEMKLLVQAMDENYFEWKGATSVGKKLSEFVPQRLHFLKPVFKPLYGLMKDMLSIFFFDEKYKIPETEDVLNLSVAIFIFFKSILDIQALSVEETFSTVETNEGAGGEGGGEGEEGQTTSAAMTAAAASFAADTTDFDSGKNVLTTPFQSSVENYYDENDKHFGVEDYYDAVSHTTSSRSRTSSSNKRKQQKNKKQQQKKQQQQEEKNKKLLEQQQEKDANLNASFSFTAVGSSGNFEQQGQHDNDAKNNDSSSSNSSSSSSDSDTGSSNSSNGSSNSGDDEENDQKNINLLDGRNNNNQQQNRPAKNQFINDYTTTSSYYGSIRGSNEVVDRNGQTIISLFRKSESFKKMTKIVATIEILRNGKAERVYFRIPETCKINLQETSQKNLIQNVDRSGDGRRISDYFERIFNLMRELDFYEVMRKTRGLSIVYKYAPLLDNIALLTAFVINLMLLGFVDVYVTGTENAPRGSDVIIETHSSSGSQMPEGAARDSYERLGLLQIVLQTILFVNYFAGPLRVYQEERWQDWQEEQNKIAIYESKQNLSILPPAVHDDAKSKLPKYRVVAQNLYYMMEYPQTWKYTLFLVLSFCGYYMAPFFYCIQPLQIVWKFPQLYAVVSAITKNRRSLLLVFILLLVILYIFAIIAYYFFSDMFTSENFGESANCDSLARCFGTIISWGLRSGGGIADLARYPIYTQPNISSWILRVLYDIVFFVVCVIVMLNLVFGLILESFSALRDERESIERNQEEQCFICGISRDELDRIPGGFSHHVAMEHNMWHYMYFCKYVTTVDPAEYTGQEAYVAACMEAHDSCWFPLQHALSYDALMKRNSSSSGSGSKESSSSKKSASNFNNANNINNSSSSSNKFFDVSSSSSTNEDNYQQQQQQQNLSSSSSSSKKKTKSDAELYNKIDKLEKMILVMSEKLDKQQTKSS